jgi:hypothetical protein
MCYKHEILSESLSAVINLKTEQVSWLYLRGLLFHVIVHLNYCLLSYNHLYFNFVDHFVKEIYILFKWYVLHWMKWEREVNLTSQEPHRLAGYLLLVESQIVKNCSSCKKIVFLGFMDPTFGD